MNIRKYTENDLSEMIHIWKVKDYSELVTVIGNLLDVNVGSVLLVQGNWKIDTKYGRQFMAVR